MTQRERVRRALLKAGPHGITCVDFLAPDVIDHGTPITRVAARVDELRKDGLPITSSGVRDSCSVYTLCGRVLPAHEPPAPAPAPVEAVPALFDAGPMRGAYSVYDDEAAA